MLGFAAGTPVAGRYLLVARMAASPAAQTWAALDDVLGRPVAVKFFALPATDHGGLRTLRSRARTAARLGHPHLVPVHDVGDAYAPGGEPVPYLVMARIDGTPLADRLVRGRLPEPEAIRIGAGLAGGLAEMHRRNLTHGEVCPSSVLLTPTGPVLVGLVGTRHLVAEEPAAPCADTGALADLILASTEAAPSLVRVCGDALSGALTMDAFAAALTKLAGTPPAGPGRVRRRLALVGAAFLGAAVTAGVGELTGAGVPALNTADTAGTETGRPSPVPAAAARPTGTTLIPSQPATIAGTPGGAGGPTPGHSGSVSASPAATASSPATDTVLAALTKLRADVTAGRDTAEIETKLGARLDSAAADLLTDARLGKKLDPKLKNFGKRVDAGVTAGDITAARAAILRADLAAVPTT
ncbi:hypothetical protein [Hamadaea tsunoensis]|uniref:hypothetical protein n=1 Tax=Hamadaea tsunoensis TaxID=53368 RepID=UPI000405D17F|nr:hypothetical protein [Hamadaea tsunoensis]